MHNNSSDSASSELDSEAVPATAKHPYLVGLGDRVRAARHRIGISRKSLAASAKVSERHLANLEYGTGNASILVLQDVAKALRSSVSELIGESGASVASPDASLIQEVLVQLDEVKLKQVLHWLRDNYSSSDPAKRRESRIALVGLRGAGKSTLGRMIASDLGFKFVELSREIEKLAGGTIGEVQAMYGVGAYRRYEKRAMEEVIANFKEVVIAAPGGVVADSGSFDLMLGHCTTIWLEATPEDHMNRVIAQGDLRPIAASKEAMDDLKAILAGRSEFYSKSNFRLNTSRQDLESTFVELRRIVRAALTVS